MCCLQQINHMSLVITLRWCTHRPSSDYHIDVRIWVTMCISYYQISIIKSELDVGSPAGRSVARALPGSLPQSAASVSIGRGLYGRCFVGALPQSNWAGKRLSLSRRIAADLSKQRRVSLSTDKGGRGEEEQEQLNRRGKWNTEKRRRIIKRRKKNRKRMT